MKYHEFHRSVLFVLTAMVASLPTMLFAENDSSGPTSDETATLVIVVENIKKIQGNLMISVYNAEEKYMKESVTGAMVPVTGETTQCVIKGLTPGEYAVIMFQDINKNDKMDTNFIGIPKEPIAFSNNAAPRFGPPKFENVKFAVEAGENEHRIKLRN